MRFIATAWFLGSLALSISFSLALGLSAQSTQRREVAQDRVSDPGPESLEPELQVMLKLINDYRASHGVHELRLSAKLTQASKMMSDDMASIRWNGSTGHVDSLGRIPQERMRAVGYTDTTVAENLVSVPGDALYGFELWKSSPGHNKNMLRATMRAIGIARSVNPNEPYQVYWVTKFGSQLDSEIQDWSKKR